MFCRECLPEWLPAINAHRKNFRLAKGETLFVEGQVMDGMYFITEGIIKIHKHWSDDKELIVRIARDGDIVGHRGLGDDNIYPASATALEATSVCYVELDFFTSSLKVNTGFLYKLMLFFASELKESEKRMRNLAHMPAKGRIVNSIVTLMNKFGITDDGRLNIVLSRQDMASYTGTTYETYFRIMNELVEEKMVRTDGKNIYVPDSNRLLEYTSQVV
jgi:CRP/FNR family transcriptional regulator